MKGLYGVEAPLDLNADCPQLLHVDPFIAQASIARGGVFLAEEKDHISWDAKKVQIFEDIPDLKKIPATVTLKWRYNMF